MKADSVGSLPTGLCAARADKADDLQRVKGIGPVNERKLHDLGIYHFDQIAAWNRQEIRWVGTYLSFPGRIDREQMEWLPGGLRWRRSGQGSIARRGGASVAARTGASDAAG